MIDIATSLDPVTGPGVSPLVLPETNHDWEHPCDVAQEWLRHPFATAEQTCSLLAEQGVPESVLKAGVVRKALVTFDGSGSFDFDGSDGERALLFAMRRGADWPADILAVSCEPSERFGLWLGLEPLLGEPFGWQIMGGATKVYRSAWDWLRGGCEGIVLTHTGRALPTFKRLERIEAVGGKDWAEQLARIHATQPGYRAPTITYDKGARS